MDFSIVYYSISFIICLFVLGRMVDPNEGVLKGMDENNELRRYFLTFCVGFVLWSISIVSVGISQSDVLDHVFLLTGEFCRLGTFVSGYELCAVLTNKQLATRKTMFKVSSELLYLGVAMLMIRLAFDRGIVTSGVFGSFLAMGSSISLIVYVCTYVIIIFFYAAYTYMYHYSCKKKREMYISRQNGIIVLIYVSCLAIESLAYAQFKQYVPTMYIGAVVGLYVFKDLVVYKRSIEYNEADYMDILAPSHEKPAFVCDDEGRIIFENTRAFVMRQTYKDKYIDKLLTDVFEITDYDKERLRDVRITQAFEVYCKYPNEPREMRLTIRHKVDKFSEIFATEVEVEYAAASDYTAPVAAALNEKEIKDGNTLSDLTFEEVNAMRMAALIKKLELCKDLYDKKNKSLFEITLKGIEKASSVLSLSALEELCDRIQTEMTYGEWESLNALMIELDRQYETLKIINL